MAMYSQAIDTMVQVNSVLAAHLPTTSVQRDTGHDSVMSSEPARRSSAKDRMAMIGVSTSNVVAMFE